MHPVAGDHAIGGALVLDLEHRALVGFVATTERLGHDAVETSTFEVMEPPLGDSVISRGSGDVHRRLGGGQRFDQCGPPLLERLLHVVGVTEREQVEGDEPGGCGFGQHRHPADRWVDPLLQRLEIKPVAAGIDERSRGMPIN